MVNLGVTLLLRRNSQFKKKKKMALLNIAECFGSLSINPVPNDTTLATHTNIEARTYNGRSSPRTLLQLS